MLGRAGRRHGYQRRSCDGRAQPRAVWATPRSAERAPASDGADDREKREKIFRFRPCLIQLPLQQARIILFGGDWCERVMLQWGQSLHETGTRLDS